MDELRHTVESGAPSALETTTPTVGVVENWWDDGKKSENEAGDRTWLAGALGDAHNLMPRFLLEIYISTRNSSSFSFSLNGWYTDKQDTLRERERDRRPQMADGFDSRATD